MIFFYVTTFNGKAIELSAKEKYSTIGVCYGGKHVGALNERDTQQLIQYLCNQGKVDVHQLVKNYEESITREDCS